MTIAAALIFKDSATYLDEWLRWHSHHGIERFYLYDNGSTDDWRHTIAHHIKPLHITPIAWPGACQQLTAYADALARARSEGIDWLAFLDDDEFLMPADPGTTLHEILPDYADAAGVAVPWILYGSGGQEKRTEGWVTERFLYRLSWPDDHVKCIVQPRHIVAPLVSGHQFQTHPGGPHMVTEDHALIDTPHATSPTAERLRLHHYLVKSWDEWRIRRSRPSVDGYTEEHSEVTWRIWDREWSVMYDPAALEHVRAILAKDRDACARNPV
jgi:hypothetical protein